MAETAAPANSESSTSGPKYHAPKDRTCQFCGVAFTSSSLGRHLDQFIKEKNPKAPDNIHDVDEIRRLRGNITRRQPRNSLRGRRESMTPASTPRAPSSVKEAEISKPNPSSSSLPKEGQYAVDSMLPKFPFAPGWEQTGVINDIPRAGEPGGDGAPSGSRRPNPQRNVSRQVVQKAQFDARQKLEDAMDTARAAELALRELLGSWRAAKQHIDGSSKPFDFDPLVLDFPALTLQCLRPPPTLFSSTQYPTPSSWSIQSPGEREFEGLKIYFKKEFSSWRLKCAAATASNEDVSYPPSSGPIRDAKEDVRRAEKAADEMERQVAEHLESSYGVWRTLPAQRRDELWLLEMARSVGRKHKEAEALKEQQAMMTQKIAHLQSQIDHLNRLQQPREFKVMAPQTIPIKPQEVAHMLELGLAQGQKGIGFSLEDRHEDLGTVVSRSIGRWKQVVASKRSVTTSLLGQRPLPDTAASPARESSAPPPKQPLPPLQPKMHATPTQSRSSQRFQSHQHAPQAQQQSHPSPPTPAPPKRVSVASTHESTSEHHPAPSQHETSACESSEVDADVDAEGDADADGDAEGDADGEEDIMHDVPDVEAEEEGQMDQDDEDADGDEDADAEMEDDISFQMMHATPAMPQEHHMQQQHQQQQHQQHQQHQQQQQQQQQEQPDMLHVPRTRGHARGNANAAFMLRHSLGPLAVSRSMPNIAGMHGSMVHGVNNDDSMYME